ncbi:MAG TPA: glycoside hydrolase family 88 protein, partial [Sunxiuqinia sp.]|nr:glycoside hydrolase family 88 protein [Sunxiuqinia sp.]
MKRYLTFIALFLFWLHAQSQSLPTKSEVISNMKLVNNYWMKTNPSPGNNQWARAAYFTGNMDFYKIYPKPKYLDYADLWASNNYWSLNGGTRTRNADNQTAGQVYIGLYQLDSVKQDYKIAAINESISRMVNSEKSDDWWWVDALYMAMPVFANLGVLNNDTAFFNKMYALYYNTKVERGLYNDTTG